MDTMQTLSAAFGTDPFTLQQARRTGVSREALRHAVAHRRLTRIGSGVFVISPDGRTTFLDRVRAAALVHHDAIVVGEAAAALHGLWCPRPIGWRTVVLAAPRAHRSYRRARLVRRTIDPVDITTVDGIRCTSAARTALDLAAQGTLAEGLVVVDSYGRLTQPTRWRALDPAFRTSIRDELLRTSARMRGTRGIDRARYAAALADPAAESAPESYARGLFIDAGYPVPAVGRPMQGADGRRYFADLYWPDRRLIVEIDGTEKYEEHQDLVDEKCREDALRAAGNRVKRILAGDLWRYGLPQDCTEGQAA